MGRIVSVAHVTLDGVMQAPARPDEDTRGGFRHGGWSVPYVDAVMSSSVGPGGGPEGGGEGGLLLGRRTYEDLYSVWPARKDGNPYTDHLNHAPKFVVSNTLIEPLAWENSTLLSGDVIGAVTELKAGIGGSLVILGSGVLVQSLVQHQLIDEFVLTIHPLVLGTGRRLFGAVEPPLALRLTEATPTTTGVIIAKYSRV